MTETVTSALRKLLRPVIAAAAIGVATLLVGCVYRMDIQQGNYLDPDAVAQLEAGMTRSQVRYLLGTPMLPDAFDSDRWDYLFYLRKGRIEDPVRRRLTVYFEGDKVASFEKFRVPEPVVAPEPQAVAGKEGASAPNQVSQAGGDGSGAES